MVTRNDKNSTIKDFIRHTVFKINRLKPVVYIHPVRDDISAGVLLPGMRGVGVAMGDRTQKMSPSCIKKVSVLLKVNMIQPDATTSSSLNEQLGDGSPYSKPVLTTTSSIKKNTQSKSPVQVSTSNVPTLEVSLQATDELELNYRRKRRSHQRQVKSTVSRSGNNTKSPNVTHKRMKRDPTPYIRARMPSRPSSRSGVR